MSAGEEDEFQRLLKKAQGKCEAFSSSEEYEPEFVELVEFVSVHPGVREIAERAFVDAVKLDTLCWELVSFCMHKFRYPAVKLEIERQIRATAANPRHWGPLSSMLQSFDDDWSDRDLYEYWRHIDSLSGN